MLFVTKELFGGTFFLRPGTPDEHVFNDCLDTGLDAIYGLLAKAPCQKLILDLGAYIGTSAITFSRKIPNATIVSLEPSPENFRLLTLNTREYENIIPVPAAVGPVGTQAPIYRRHTGEWGHTLVAEPDDCQNPARIAEVQVLTIKDIMETYNRTMARPALLKIDIEGYEYGLLQDTRWAKAWPLIMIELHDRIKAGCSALWADFLQRSGVVEIYADHEKRVCVDEQLLFDLYRAGAMP